MFLVRFDSLGNVATWGFDFVGGVEVAMPDDWLTHGPAKYVANDDSTGLVVRPGWTDLEPES